MRKSLVFFCMVFLFSIVSAAPQDAFSLDEYGNPQGGQIRILGKKGQLDEVRHYVNGKLFGDFIKYYEDGENMKYRASYKHDIIDGHWFDYDRAGNITMIRFYKKGSPVWLDFYEGNYRLKRVYITEGDIDLSGHGQIETYFPTDVVKTKTEFKNNKKHGYDMEFYENGHLKKYHTYKNDVLDGKYVSYYDNTFIKQEGYYKNGKKSGKWIEYDLDTNITNTTTY